MSKKISQLTDGTSFQAGDEAVVNRSGTNYKVDPTQFGSSIDVTGTVTADGLTVSSGGDTFAYIDARTSAGNGETATLQFWSKNAFGTNNFGQIRYDGDGDFSIGSYGSGASSVNLTFATNGSEAMRITSAGLVGIGTSSPGGPLDCSGTNDTGAVTYFFRNKSNIGNTTPSTVIRFTQRTNNADSGRIVAGRDGAYDASIATMDSYMAFFTAINNADIERMRIDSSGNLLLGKTVNSLSVEGIQANASALFSVVRSGGTTQYLNRLTSDGDIVQFAKDGTVVGSIGSKDFGGGLGSRLFIGEGDTGLGFQVHVDNSITPIKTDGGTRDNVLNLGAPSHRFKDLYLSGGVYLGGTGAANLLDDYEEGTFTPVFADASTGGTSVNGNYGYYTKVGDMVTVHFAIINMDTSGMTAGNAVYFRGLPFTSATISGPGFFIGSTRTSLVTSTGNPTANVAEEATYGTFHDGGTILVSDVTSGSGDFYVTVTYRAA